MIYTFRLFDVCTTDIPAFTAAFEDGPWRRLSVRLSGHLHTGLLVQSKLASVSRFLSLEIWQSEQHYLAAQATANFQDFHRSLRLLAVSHQRVGTFSYHYPPDTAQIPSYSTRMPATPSVQKVSQ